MDGSEKTEVRYHLVRTLPRRERDVAQALRVEREGVTAAGRSGLGLATLLPIERVADTRRGRRIETDRPLFSTLCLVAWDPNDLDLWHEVRDTPGVVGILTRNERPVPITERDLELLWELLDEDAVYVPPNDVPQYGFDVNDHVQIALGPFAGHHGICFGFKTVNPDKVYVAVKISLLGRDVVVPVPLTWCENSTLSASILSRTALTGSLSSSADKSKRRGNRSHKARLARIRGRHKSEIA